MPPTFKILKDTIASEGLCNVTPNPKAVSNESGQLEIHMPGQDHARPSIQKHSRESWHGDETIQSFPCEATTIDDYVQTNLITSIDFLKIDVEGAELLVLQGARKLLLNQKPILFFEMWSAFMKDFGNSTEDFCTLIRQSGYDQFLVVQENLHAFTDLEKELPEHLKNGILNLVCGKGTIHASHFASLKTNTA